MVTAAGATPAAILVGGFVNNVTRLKTMRPQAPNCIATIANK